MLCIHFNQHIINNHITIPPKINFPISFSESVFFPLLSLALYSFLLFQPPSLILSYLLSGDSISACRLKQSSAEKYQTDMVVRKTRVQTGVYVALKHIRGRKKKKQGSLEVLFVLISLSDSLDCDQGKAVMGISHLIGTWTERSCGREESFLESADTGVIKVQLTLSKSRLNLHYLSYLTFCAAVSHTQGSAFNVFALKLYCCIIISQFTGLSPSAIFLTLISSSL